MNTYGVLDLAAFDRMVAAQKVMLPKNSFDESFDELVFDEVIPSVTKISSFVHGGDDLNFDIPENEFLDIPEKKMLQKNDRMYYFLSSMESVGIISEDYEVDSCFYPHAREFYFLGQCGEMTYEGETIESYDIPTLGAEKFSKGILQAVGVASEAGILATGLYTDIIDAAREKLDGDEVVVYTIETRTKKASFVWSSLGHTKLNQVVGSGHFEQVGDKLYYLSGENSLGGIKHQWEYLTQALVDKVREGLIVRLSSKEYRIPALHSAVFEVKDKWAGDLSGVIRFFCGLPDGLWNFTYNKMGKTWSVEKPRFDRNCPDHITGIEDMLQRTITMEDFVVGIVVSDLPRCNTPEFVEIVPLPLERVAKIKSAKVKTNLNVKVTGNYKHDDSFRRVTLEDNIGNRVDTMKVGPIRKNVISTSGKVNFLPRHKSHIMFSSGKKFYVTDAEYGTGNARVFRLVRGNPWSININGPVFRVYEVNWRKFAKKSVVVIDRKYNKILVNYDDCWRKLK